MTVAGSRSCRPFVHSARGPSAPAGRVGIRVALGRLHQMSEIRTAPTNGITIAYQTFGDESAVPILLVMGLGTQMIGWRDGFCDLLAERGH